MSIKTKLKHIKWINIVNFNIYTVIPTVEGRLLDGPGTLVYAAVPLKNT
jgi:hypothetical protein